MFWKWDTHKASYVMTLPDSLCEQAEYNMELTSTLLGPSSNNKKKSTPKKVPYISGNRTF